jgi:hypothetical protein
METSLNSRLLSTSTSSKDHHDSDGSKDHVSLLNSKSSIGNSWHSSSKDALQDHPRRRQGSRSSSSTVANSLYDSPKLNSSSSERRQASVPGSSSASFITAAESPILTQNLADLWSDTAMSESRLSEKEPSASLIIEDATPPLPWKDPSSRFTSGENLSSSQRFSVDTLSGGGRKESKTNLLGRKDDLLSHWFVDHKNDSPIFCL